MRNFKDYSVYFSSTGEVRWTLWCSSWQDPQEELWENEIPEDKVPPEIRALLTPEIIAEETQREKDFEARWEVGRHEREAAWAAEKAVKAAQNAAKEADRAAKAQEALLRNLHREAEELEIELGAVRGAIARLEGKK